MAGLTAFVFATPRLMGPDHFGRFAALVSLTSLLILASALGAQATFARFVPEYQATGRTERTRVLFTQLFVLRGLAASLLGTLFFLVFPKVLDGTSGLTAALGAATLVVGAVSTTAYQLCYGLNDLGRWLTRDALNRPLLLVFLVVLGGLHSPDRAALALFLTELSLLVLGSVWVRSYFLVGRDAFDLRVLLSHLSFGFAFFVGNLLALAVWRGGETAIATFSGDQTEIAYFSVAATASMTASAFIGQLANMITPTVTAFHLAGDAQRVDIWLGNSLKYLTIVCVAILLVVWAAGEVVVPRLLGTEYLPVATNLRILVIALVPVTFTRTAMSLAIARSEPGRSLVSSASGLLAFGLAAIVLVPMRGSVGASWAVLLGVSTSAVIAYFQFPMRSMMAAAKLWRLLAVGALATAIVAAGLRVASPALAGIAVLFYPALLFASGVISRGEVSGLARRF
jgi:O-antigen/teichoic acid export membrane protein